MTRLPSEGTMVIRGGLVVFASEGLAALFGRPAPELVGRASIDFLVPEDRRRMLEVLERRDRGEAIPPSLELTVLLPDGTTRATEGHFEYDGPDAIVHVRDLGADSARRRLLEAIAATGVAVRAETSEDAVLARVRDELASVGVVSALLRLEGDRAHAIWVGVPDALREDFRALARGVAPEDLSGPVGEFARRISAEGCAFTDDWAAGAANYLPPASGADARSLIARAGFGRSIGVRIDRPGDPGLYLVVASSLLRGEDVPAFRLFGAQLSAALEVTRTISDLSRRNAHLDVLAQVAALAGDATDLPAFLSRASELVRPLGRFSGIAVWIPDESGTELRLLYMDNASGVAALRDRSSRSPMSSPLGEVLRSRTARATPVPYPGGDPGVMAAMPFQAIAWIPLVARSRGVGVLVAGFREGGVADAEASLELLTAVGAHFASAIESQRLFGDLRRRVGELTLLVDVARASAQLDPALLLEAAVRRISATVRAGVAAAFLRERDRLRLLSSLGLDADCARALDELPADAGVLGTAIAQRAVMHTSAEEALREPLPERCRSLGPLLAIPLLAKNDVVGLLVLARGADGPPFDPGEAALLSSVGAQLGLAVDAARLFANVRRRLSDFEAVQALTLQVFASAPGDVGALLRDACREIARALAAPSAAVFLLEAGATRLHPAASFGMPPGFDAVVVDVAKDSLAAEAMRTRAPQQTLDTAADPRSQLAGRTELGALSALCIPLAARHEVEGVVYVADRMGRRFGPDEIAVASALAGALGLGLENAHLYADARRRAEQLGLLHEVGRSLVETLDLEQILNAGVRNLARIVDAPDVYLSLLGEGGDTLEFRAIAGDHEHLRGTVLPARPAEHNLAARVIATREPIAIEDARADPTVNPELMALTGGRAYLALPLIVRDRTIGAIVIIDPRGPRLFTPPEMERATAVANQLAVATDNARLYEDLRRSYSELARAQQALVQRERLAALGELSAVVAHEVRNPLGVIFNSLGSLRRLVRPTGDARTLFRIVEEEAERLNRIVGDLLDFARPSTPDLHAASLSRVAEEAVASAIAQQETPVEVSHEHDPALPDARIDPRLVRQAILNVAVNAVQAMARGGRITVRTLRDGDAAVVEIEDDGPGIPQEVRERIFEPFFTTKATGTGLGLAVVRRIVEGHGGTIRVRAAHERGTVFALRFPLVPESVENGPGMHRQSGP